MPRYKIANLNVEMKVQYSLLASRARQYRIPDNHCTPADIILDIPKEYLAERCRSNPCLGMQEYEYLCYGSAFYRRLLPFGGMMLHASAVAYENQAYLFSAPCATGKSTHAQQWKACFGDQAQIINDDKPAIRLIGNRFYACGTPFSGKTDQSSNICVPLQGICILEQGEKNVIEPVDSQSAVYALLHQTIRTLGEDKMEKLLELLEQLVKRIPIYRLRCTISQEAARLAYRTMKEPTIP